MREALEDSQSCCNSLKESNKKQIEELSAKDAKIDELGRVITDLENNKQYLQDELSKVRQSAVSEEIVSTLRNDNAEKDTTIKSLV
jgi:hypothetical protein